MSVLAQRADALSDVLARLGDLDRALVDAAAAVATAFAAGGTLFVAGNGGSAAEAQHLTGELIGRLSSTRERGPLPAVSLHADTSALTAVGNDYGYEQIFARQVDALGRPGDVLLVLSTSGSSANLVAAVDVANARGMTTIGMLGAGVKPLHERCAHVLAVDADGTQLVQECHLVLVHVFVELIEDQTCFQASPSGSSDFVQ